MIRFVNAKINLGLNVTSKRPDGYHELETVFYPVGLYNGTVQNPEPFNDILEIHPCDTAHKDEFLFSGNPIACPPEKNLVYKAVKAFKEAAGNKKAASPNFTTHLEKHIPDGAGLGGGSADASFTLRIINELCGNPLTHKELTELAATLGADCPFFIENRPVAASGIGEIMQPIDLDLSGYWAVIIKPDIYISTKEAFSGISPRKPDRLPGEIVKLPVELWEEEGLRNDFEPHIFRQYPRLDEIKRYLKEEGALYASMSGSGSSIFGIFADRSGAHKTYMQIGDHLDKKAFAYICRL